MTTEENKRMLALSYIVADLKAENIEMTQRVHQLVDDYNNVARSQHQVWRHQRPHHTQVMAPRMPTRRTVIGSRLAGNAHYAHNAH